MVTGSNFGGVELDTHTHIQGSTGAFAEVSYILPVSVCVHARVCGCGVCYPSG